MLYGEKLREICNKLGIDPEKLDDKLYSTLLDEICNCCGSGGGSSDELVKQLIDGTITEIVIPEGTTKIYHYGFYGFANLTKVIIPNGVKTIGREAFYYCTNLTNLIIPASVTDISVYALRCGSSSNKVTFRFEGTTPPKIQSGTFSALGDIEKIEVPMLAVDTYKTTTNWANYAEKIVGY